MKTKLHFYVFALVYSSFFQGYAQPGSPDVNFGNGGLVTTSFGNDDAEAFAIAIQTDGKIVVAGVSDPGSGNFTLVRYRSNGNLDSFFGDNGKVNTDFNNGKDVAKAIAIQKNGKLLLAGYCYASSGNQFAIARYNDNGNLDLSFGSGGKKTISFGSSANSYGNAIAIQTDGKILVAGSNWNGSSDQFALVRLDSDGSPDNSFGNNGIVTTSIGSNADIAYSLAIQGDGKIVVAGSSDNGSGEDFVLVRYNTDGSKDTSFNHKGIVITDFDQSANIGRSVIIQDDGKIVVAGYTWVSAFSHHVISVARYKTNGQPDSSFSLDGKNQAAIGIYDCLGNAALLQQDAKIVVAGKSFNGSNDDFGIIRFDYNGEVDTNFGNKGIVTTNFGSNDRGYAVALQRDGKIVVAGESNANFALARYIGCPLEFHLNLDICYGSSIKIGEHLYSTSGIYLDTLISSAGCDSFLTTYLNVLPANQVTQYPAICQGQGIIVGNHTYNYGGTYRDTLLARNGCDSFVTTHLTVNPLFKDTFYVKLNYGDSIRVGKHVYRQAGIYTDTMLSVKGCDSIQYTKLTIVAEIALPQKLNQLPVLFPNPFSYSATLYFGRELHGGTLIIYNILGQPVRIMSNLTGKSVDLSRNEFSIGMYFLQILEQGHFIWQDKMMIHGG